MTATAFVRFCSCFLLAFGLAIALPGPVQSGETNPFDSSLASDLLQSRAQLRIYRHDDQADLACQSRNFVAAKVVRTPRDHVTYDVYFTEVGEGGAIFSFLEVQ